RRRALARSLAMPAAGARAVRSRTELLLEGPVLSTLLRLAAPNVIVMLLQAVVSTVDGVFVGWLGADALAGVSLVFPLVMLMQTMSAGGMGGGVASAIARALGGGRRADAHALAAHALAIALGMAALFTGTALFAGPALYHAMGGRGAALDAALLYSQVIFGGALAYWLYNTLGAVVRGTGNMALPAAVMVGNGVVYLLLSPALISGWGPLPRLGVAGAAVASVTAFALGSAVLLAYLISGRTRVTLPLPGSRAQGALFGELVRVGAPGSQHRAHESHDRAGDGAGRPLRRVGARRLRHGGAARVSPDSAGVRPGRGARHDGRHQRRRRESRAGGARGVGGRGPRGGGEPPGRALPRALLRGPALALLRGHPCARSPR